MTVSMLRAPDLPSVKRRINLRLQGARYELQESLTEAMGAGLNQQITSELADALLAIEELLQRPALAQTLTRGSDS